MPVRSEIICPVFAGPDLSADNLELSNLSVSGQPSSDGYTVSVSFNIKNARKEDINLTSKGIFVATRDPSGEKLDFGFTNGNTILKPDSTLKFNATTKIEKERRGLWEFYPSYEIWVQGTFMQKPVIIAKEGPKDWHACFFSYCPDYCKDNIRYYGGYIGQEETCVYKQEKCPAGCDSTGLKCAELPSPTIAVDTDGDGIKDEIDQCPKQKETFNGYLDNDGCPDTLPVKDKTPPSVSVQHTPLDVNTST
ncbi:MAG: hypothetical protein QXM75_03345 [Candidatus Diapherotrites archaeon]